MDNRINHIAAVVVTYNRCELLKKCLESLNLQTYKAFDIVVVNNGSTDGTKEFLDNLDDIIVIHQDNRGGAGGFYTGMKYAFDSGYDWIWMMDDDGYTDKDQLKCLLNGAKKWNAVFLNALVVDINDPSKLAFGISEKSIPITNTSDALTYEIVHAINPFNGTFINREVVSKIGLVKKEMFIYGDERDYQYRAIEAGIDTITITAAIHYHPRIKNTEHRVFPFLSRYTVTFKPKRFAHIYYRNSGYLNQKYINKFYQYDCASRVFILYLIYFLIRLKMRELFVFIRYYNKGRNCDFS